MTKFMNERFSVSTPGTQSYRDNWDAIFAPKTHRTEDGVALRVGDKVVRYGEIGIYIVHSLHDEDLVVAQREDEQISVSLKSDQFIFEGRE